MDLPCDGDGVCMSCKRKPPIEQTLHCKTCATPWHVTCLSAPPHALLHWDCPDCSSLTEAPPPPTSISAVSGDLISAIRAIEADPSLTDLEKAKRRQHLMSGGVNTDGGEKDEEGGNGVLDVLDANLNCSFCLNLLDRPVTTPCGHNFCLKCFQKWVGQGKRTCGKCRSVIPSKMVSQPRINAALVVAIRMAKMPKSASSGAPPKPSYFIHNQNRPDKAFTTERAKKAGKANACSGKIFVTVPPDHFGPILADNDPERKQGVLVGECWEGRMECRQWGVHLPHVAGIAGQSDYGAQSVALSGGYEDDEDHGEWFLYTGSGGRDLSGNKRTNKEQSFDQKFEKYNEALRVSCRKGYPVRVVRSHKEKRSSYAPDSGVRYDGVYRIEKCWRKSGIQGFKVCRYLFVRCDNEPAPWTSDEHGDHPRPFPVIQELKKATDITERKGSPAWDYDEETSCWKWKIAPPLSRKTMDDGNPEDRKKERRARRQDQNLSVREKLLKEFSCLICRKVMTLPLTTPCAHNFCKPCLEGAFAGQNFTRERHCEGRRTLRTQKNIMKCPSCPADISDFLQNPQINRELMGVIVSLQEKAENNVEEKNENFEESNEEESNSSKEKLDPVDEDDEIDIEKNEDLDCVVKDAREDVTEGKAKQINQHNKCDDMNDKPLPAQCAESKEATVSSEIPDSGKDTRPMTKKSYKQKIVDEKDEKSPTKKPQALCKETEDASLKILDSSEGIKSTMRKTRNQKKADEKHEKSPAKNSHAPCTEIKDVTVSFDELPNSSKADAKTATNKTRKRKKDSETDPFLTHGRRVTRSMVQKALN